MLGVENLQQYSKRIPDDFNNMYLKVKSTLNIPISIWVTFLHPITRNVITIFNLQDLL